MSLCKKVWVAIIAVIFVITCLTCFSLFYKAPDKTEIPLQNDLVSLIDDTKNEKDSIDLYVENWEEIALSRNPLWDKFLMALAHVESRNNDSVKGKYDNANSLGRYQITPVFVRQCNIYLGKNYFTLNDRYSQEKQKQMIFVINHNMNPTFSIEKAIKIHNPRASSKYKKEILAEMLKDVM